MWQWLKDLILGMFNRKAENEFSIEIDSSAVPIILQSEKISSGNPPWANEELKPTNLAVYINNFTSSLVTLDISISCPDTPRGRWLQSQADYVLEVIQEKASEALGGCGIMLKPNGINVDYIKPTDFAITDWDSNGNILGAVFQSQVTKNKKVYTKMEYHRFEGEWYVVSNRCFVSDSSDQLGKPCELSAVEDWKDLKPDVGFKDLERPLFSFFKNPVPNKNTDVPLGVPIWWNCLKELEDYDIAWNRKADEIFDSTHTTFVPDSAVRFYEGETGSDKTTLPRYVRSVQYSGIENEQITEHVATLLTEQRISDINSILSVIAMKCGFNQGTFVFNENTNYATATQVEADQQTTIRTIQRIRTALVKSLQGLFYALNVMADLETTLPVEMDVLDDIIFDFQDITYNFEEDRANWWKYRVQGDVPAWMYYVKFEGMTEDEAKAMVEEATPPMDTTIDSFFS